MKASNFPEIPDDKFQFVQQNEKIYDEKFKTKPIGYFKDAWHRFRKSVGSVIAAFVLFIIILFAIFGQMMTDFDMSYSDMHFKNALPKSEYFSRFGFWDGTKKVDLNEKQYKFYTEEIPEAGYILEDLGTYEKFDLKKNRNVTYYKVRVNTYKYEGFIYKLVSGKELTEIKAYEKESGIQLMYPLLKDFISSNDANGDNILIKDGGPVNEAFRSGDQKIEPGPFRIQGEPVYEVDRSGKGTQYSIRVLNYENFVFENGHEPSFIFGSNSHGQDIFVRLATGARLSLLLGLAVAVINITIGVFYGAVEGYYGSTSDLLMQRLVEILSALPFIVLVTLFQLHLSDKLGVLPTLLFAFVVTGWIGTSNTVRQQFYRYKNREYVLAARTLGAKDHRLIFRHILPNAIGPIITATVLVIPGVIFTESMLSYLNIVDLSSSPTLTSIGSLLSDGQASIRTNPHIITFPAVFISILMISFNVFGNGLRDAFNPSLRGVEE